MLLTRGCVAGLHVPNRSGREALCGVGDVLRKVSVDLELFRGASGGGGGAKHEPTLREYRKGET